MPEHLFSRPAQDWMHDGAFLLIVAGITLVALRLLKRAVPALAAKLQLPPLSLRPLTIVGRILLILIAGSMLTSRFLGLEILPLIGGILALVAIGFFAVWSTLSNVLCTFFILLVRPYRIGDDLELVPDPIRGRVSDMNLFFTTLTAEDGRLIQIPNNVFFQRTLHRRPNSGSTALADSFQRTPAKP